MYKVLHHFTDMQDHDYPYCEGDIFPRKGLKVSVTRLNELASGDNRRGKPLIRYIEDEVEPKEKKPKKAAARSKETAEK